jgi:hypothetical protein
LFFILRSFLPPLLPSHILQVPSSSRLPSPPHSNFLQFTFLCFVSFVSCCTFILHVLLFLLFLEHELHEQA